MYRTSEPVFSETAGDDCSFGTSGKPMLTALRPSCHKSSYNFAEGNGAPLIIPIQQLAPPVRGFRFWI